MINTREIERIIETYQYKNENKDVRQSIEREFPGSDLEICYALTLINIDRYSDYIVDRLYNAKIQEIIIDYEQLSLYEKLIPSYFTKYELLKDRQSNIDLDFFLFERGIVDPPIFDKYSIEAYYNLYLTLKINENDAKFSEFIGLFAYEVFLAKYGESIKLDQLISDGVATMDDLADYIKWAKIKYNAKEKSIVVEDIILKMENKLEINESLKLSTDDINSHKNELIVKAIHSGFSKNDNYIKYLVFLKYNDIDYSSYFVDIFLRLVSQDENSVLSNMINSETKDIILHFEKKKIYDVIVNKMTINSLIVLIDFEIIERNDFIYYYLDRVCRDLPNSNMKVIDLSLLKNLQNYYGGNLELKNNVKMVSITSYLKMYPKPENLNIRQEIQDILFTDYYSEIPGENFSTLFPELYKDLLFIEKYNMFIDFSDFQQYFKDLNLTKSGKGQDNFLSNHITQIFLKLDRISTIISNALVEWSLIDTINLENKRKIVNNMIESINNVNSMLKYILDLIGQNDVKVEDLFNEEYVSKNKFKNLNFIKNSGFGELKINGLFSFDGSNEELSDIVELLHLQIGKVSKSKEIDHYTISMGTPPKIDLFETKNLSRILTYDEEKYLLDICSQQDYLNSLIIKYKDKVEFKNHIFINNGYSIFTEKILKSFGFSGICGFCLDFSLDPEDIIFVSIIRRLKSVFSVKNANLLEKTPEFMNFMKMAVLKILDNPKIEDKVILALDKNFLVTIEEKNIKNMYNQSFRIKIGEKVKNIKSKYSID